MHNYQPNSCSMFFSMPNYDQNIYPYASSNSPSVDCTLSLAPPSSDDFDSPESRPSSRFCWDFLQSADNHSHNVPPSYKPNRGGATNVSAVDSLLARRCANCDTTSTPLWRNGPRGPKSLCNACGIRFKKEERRASATATATAVGGGDATEDYNGNTWMQQHTRFDAQTAGVILLAGE